MHYDLGYFDDETCRLEPIDNPFGPKVLPMSRNDLLPVCPEWTRCAWLRGPAIIDINTLDLSSTLSDLWQDANPCLSHDHVFANTLGQLQSSQRAISRRD